MRRDRKKRKKMKRRKRRRRQTLLADLAQLLVAQILHLLPEVQDGVSYGLKGSIRIGHHRGEVPRLQGGVQGLACLKENRNIPCVIDGVCS